MFLGWLMGAWNTRCTDSNEEGLHSTVEITFLPLLSPFWEILDEDWEEGIPAILRRLSELEDELKKLKRHKHDERTGDVMIRI